MKVHLVSYATRRFQVRQKLLGWSARANRVADTVDEWDPKRLIEDGFADFAPDVSLRDRGSGFWSWKPFIIGLALSKYSEGDLVFYCDVGRRYPFKTLRRSALPLVDWMSERRQSVMPGLRIPWKGPMSMWTKRAAFVATGQDNEAVHRSAPIQASFSLWRVDPSSRRLCASWQQLCRDRELISDDPSPTELTELPDFVEHRHDQALLSLCCFRSGVVAIDLGEVHLPIDTQHPDHVFERLGVELGEATPLGKMIGVVATALGAGERIFRKAVKFGIDRPESAAKP